MVSFKWAHFPRAIILMCVRWYVAYPLSYRQLEELTPMLKKGQMTPKEGVKSFTPAAQFSALAARS
jgi:transposase-like protein